MAPQRRFDIPSMRGWPRLDGRLIGAGLVGAALAVLYVPVFAHAVDVWTSDQEFSFGLFVPPLTVGLVWTSRRKLRGALGPGWNGGLLALVCGLVILIASARTGIHALGGASFGLAFLGAAAFLYGRAAALALLFPTVLLTLAMSLYRGLLSSVGFYLQGLTARYAAAFATMLGVAVRREGVDLFAGRFHFVVAEACSGLSSLLALLCLGILIAAFARTSLPRQLVLILVIVPIVLVANVVRVTLVLAFAQFFGLAVANGFVHSFFSAALFLMALCLLCVVGSALEWYPRTGATA